MTAAIDELDQLMERASQALAEMNYALCEALCVEALGKAHQADEWVLYRRIVLPLQEARRQKRQAAIDGLVLLGTAERAESLEKLIEDPRCGCIVVTWPYTAEDAWNLHRLARDNQRQIEVLFADNEAGDAAWHVTSFDQPSIRIDLPAAKPEWVGQWVDALDTTPPTPAHWFMQASEALGNAALASIEAAPGTPAYLDQLERAIQAAGDHEILHQRLADAARMLHEAGHGQ